MATYIYDGDTPQLHQKLGLLVPGKPMDVPEELVEFAEQCIEDGMPLRREGVGAHRSRERAAQRRASAQHEEHHEPPAEQLPAEPPA